MGIDAKNIQRKYNYLSTILTNREYAEERKLFDYGSTISDKYSALYDESTKIESKIEIKLCKYEKRIYDNTIDSYYNCCTTSIPSS